MLKEEQDKILEETKEEILKGGFNSMSSDARNYIWGKYELKRLNRGDVIAVSCLALQYLFKVGEKDESKVESNRK